MNRAILQQQDYSKMSRYPKVQSCHGSKGRCKSLCKTIELQKLITHHYSNSDELRIMHSEGEI
jgi:hypothetical protein